jgi:alpha/beta superfamily hydrolase
METKLKIKTSDGKIVDGLLRGPISQPLVVLVHGLGGYANEALLYNAARYFEKNGFSSFRFNLYSWGKKNRKLYESTFKINGQDIDAILNFLVHRGAKKIFLAGHSYGFPSILHSKLKDVVSIASWDGSFLPHRHFNSMKELAAPFKGRFMDKDSLSVFGEGMIKEAGQVRSLSLVKAVNKPIKFITVPGRLGNLIGAKKMYKVAFEPKELKIIAGATHNFFEDGKQEELYAETLKWFGRF